MLWSLKLVVRCMVCCVHPETCDRDPPFGSNINKSIPCSLLFGDDMLFCLHFRQLGTR